MKRRSLFGALAAAFTAPKLVVAQVSKPFAVAKPEQPATTPGSAGFYKMTVGSITYSIPVYMD